MAARKATVRPRQQRALETRQRLIEAAIACLNRHGFGGTTMPRVAAAAGVSAGPRQYYFPTREDLFDAVVEHLIARQRERLVPPGRAPVEELLRELIERGLRFSGSPEQTAMLEIRLALKHEDALRERVGHRIAALEADNDRSLFALLQATGRTEQEVAMLRRLLSAVSRGLSFEPDIGDACRAMMARRLHGWLMQPPPADA